MTARRRERVTLTLLPEDLAAVEQLGGDRAALAARAMRFGLAVLLAAADCDDPAATLRSRWRPLLGPLPRRWARRK